jgi:hypothetical protein
MWLPRTVHPIELEPFMNAVAQSPVSALLLDYDGTLAPFCLHRDQAFPYPGVRPLLQAIIASGRTRVVVITGRNAPEVIPLLSLQPSPEVWGCHGVERLRPDGTCERPRVKESVLRALADADLWLSQRGLHNRAEFKTGAVAIHWRGLDEQTAAETHEHVLQGWLPIASGPQWSFWSSMAALRCACRAVTKGMQSAPSLRKSGLRFPSLTSAMTSPTSALSSLLVPGA